MATTKIKNRLLPLLVIFFVHFIGNNLFAQKLKPFQRNFSKAYSSTDDTLKLEALIRLSLTYQFINPDSSLPIAKRAESLLNKISAEQFKPQLYNCYASAYISLQHSDSGLYWTKKAFEISKKDANLKQIANSINNFGVFYSNTGYNHISTSFYNKSLFIREAILDSAGIASCLNNMANTNMKLGNYLEAKFQLLKSIAIKIKKNDSNSLARSYMNLSNIYLSLGQFDKALQALQTAENWQELAGSEAEYFSIHTNLGGTYYFQEKYEESKKEFQLSLKNALETRQLMNQAMAYNNLGEVETKLGNYQDALEHFTQAKAICKIVKDYEAEASSLLGTARVLAIKKDYKNAIPLFIKGIEIYDKYDFKPNMVDNLSELISIFEKTGDYQSALKWYKKQDKVIDELAALNSKEKIQKLEYENELAQKQAEISILEKEKELSVSISWRNKIIISLLLIVIISISIVLFFVLKSRKEKIADNLTIKHQAEKLSKQAEELIKLNAIKDKTFSILSHDLKSPLVSLQQTLFMLDENLIEKDEFIFIKDSLREKFSSLNQLLENLLNWSRARISGDFVLRPEIIIIQNIIQQNIKLFSSQSEQKQLEIICNIDPKHCCYGDFNQIDLVLRNVLINAIKFSYTGGRIIISSLKTVNSCFISIQDFGTGMNLKELDLINQGDLSASKPGTIGEKGTGIGLMISRDFIIQNKGKLNVKSEPGKGTTISIELPVA